MPRKAKAAAEPTEVAVNKTARKPRAKKAPAVDEVVEKLEETVEKAVESVEEKVVAPAKKAAKAPRAKKAAVIIQSPFGGEITPEAILSKIGPADKVYIRVDENKAYWVKGEETGSVDLW